LNWKSRREGGFFVGEREMAEDFVASIGFFSNKSVFFSISPLKPLNSALFHRYHELACGVLDSPLSRRYNVAS
jgi:hypothetical protein